MPGTAGPAVPKAEGGRRTADQTARFRLPPSAFRLLRARPWRFVAVVAAAVGTAAVGVAQYPEPPGGRLPFVPPLGAASGLPNIVVPNLPNPAPSSEPLTDPSPIGSRIEDQGSNGAVVRPDPLAADTVTGVPGAVPLDPQSTLLDPVFSQAPTPAAASATPTFPWSGPRKPLPGSLADQVQRDYAARDLFRFCTWRDGTVTMFPSTLLWEPPLAIFREPRMQAMYTSLNNYKGPETLETSLGADFGVFRFEPVGSDLAIQLDLFGVAHTRLSPDDVMAQSYRFGFPVTFRRGPWHAKLGYEHTSDHLGDELIFHTGRKFTRYAKDEFVFGIGRYFYDRLRVYGQWSYAGYQDLPQAYNRNRYDAGFEYYDRRPTGFCGTPFLAFNATWRGEQKHSPITTTQLGWLWRNPEARLASLRVFGEYYSGGSPYGQFFQDGREHWFAIGLAGDY